MMTAYDETYLSGAQKRLGTMIDVAVNEHGCNLESFYLLFAQSPLAAKFGAGDPAVIAGRSGEELAFEVLRDSQCQGLSPKTKELRTKVSAEYWVGWALAFYQWASGFSFWEIQQRVAISQAILMYQPYHEMDIRQFCDKMDELCTCAHPRTNVQERRLAAGLSQSQLAAASNIPLRTLQQYEQRQKDINRARADYVVSLARALCCKPADLLEHHAAAGFEYAVVKLQ